jgi:hypothetical protein
VPDTHMVVGAASMSRGTAHFGATYSHPPTAPLSPVSWLRAKLCDWPQSFWKLVMNFAKPMRRNPVLSKMPHAGPWPWPLLGVRKCGSLALILHRCMFVIPGKVR